MMKATISKLYVFENVKTGEQQAFDRIDLAASTFGLTPVSMSLIVHNKVKSKFYRFIGLLEGVELNEIGNLKAGEEVQTS